MVTVGDVQDFSDALAHLADASRARSLSAVKSLLSFGCRIGYLPFNVGAPVRLPRLKDTIAERILAEEQVLKMLTLEAKPRNAALLRLLYGAGLRVSELVGLRWRDVVERDDAAQVTARGARCGRSGTMPAPMMRCFDPRAATGRWTRARSAG